MYFICVKLCISFNDLEDIWNYSRCTYSYLKEILEAAFCGEGGKKEWDLIDLKARLFCSSTFVKVGLQNRLRELFFWWQISSWFSDCHSFIKSSHKSKHESFCVANVKIHPNFWFPNGILSFNFIHNVVVKIWMMGGL